MTFEEILNQAMALLQRQGRVSYRALKRQFDLDEAYVEDIKLELIEVHQVAVDQDNTMLVWIGGAAASPPAASEAALARAHAPDTAPLTYTPSHLTDKILAARPTLEGERKQVTVLFADLKDSTELIRGLDPEAAQQLLDPALQRMMDAVHRFEGTVNQVLVTASWPCLAPRLPMKTTPCAPAMPRWPCRRLCSSIRGGAPQPRPGAAHARGA